MRCSRLPAYHGPSRPSTPGCPVEAGRAVSLGSVAGHLDAEQGRMECGNGSTLAVDHAGGRRIHLVRKRTDVMF